MLAIALNQAWWLLLLHGSTGRLWHYGWSFSFLLVCGCAICEGIVVAAAVRIQELEIFHRPGQTLPQPETAVYTEVGETRHNASCC